MRVNVSPRKRNAPRPAYKSAPQFLQWLRGRQCAVNGAECSGKIEAAHVDHGGDKGMGTKVSDKFAVPMCSFHHLNQHSRGWLTFQAKHDIDALAAARAYWWAWPGRFKWESEHGE
jgi:hypothetical protein